ncbi:SDR family oxidoreductase [Streptomyces angustmyceticus]|uniref:SDR family oxidoreductase n=1 Tax=Streptomyces angustmyceticus TaxID=285578 RepID=UPI0021AED575|nr:SDR family oxidoreductase [Streptomyces angustmyceticus]
MPDLTALVLGGTSGIGSGIARKLAAQGAAVTIAGRDRGRAEEAADSIRSALGVADVSGKGLDLSRPADVAETVRGYGRDFDAVVLNGPGYPPGTLKDATADDFTRAYQSMFLSLQQVVTSVIDGMKRKRRGRVLYVSSSSVIVPINELAVSSVVRAAMNAYMKLLSNELAADRITVNSIIPGRIDTPRVKAVDAARARDRSTSADQIRKAAEGHIPLGRYGTPDEIGELAAFLCSDRAAYLTGATFRCDGGMIAAL